MRKVLTLVAVLVALVATGCSSGSGGVSTVGVDEFTTAISQPSVTVIDVRTPAEYAAGHVDGAVNIDVEGGAFDQGIAELDPAGAYAVYCRSGRRSQIAADTMAEAGFTNVTNLQGGFEDLAAAGVPVAAG